MATVATPVVSTGCDDILALYKGLVQATPGTRTLEMRVGEITISAAPAQQRRNKVAAKPPASTSTREPPSRATTTSAQRRAVNRAAAHAGQPPPFPKKGATANPNADQELQHAPTRGASTEASARLSTAPQAPEAHPAQPPAAPPQPPAPPAASPPTQLNTLEPLHHPPPHLRRTTPWCSPPAAPSTPPCRWRGLMGAAPRGGGARHPRQPEPSSRRSRLQGERRSG